MIWMAGVDHTSRGDRYETFTRNMVVVADGVGRMFTDCTAERHNAGCADVDYKPVANLKSTYDAKPPSGAGECGDDP
jgi:hypothetical protein